MSQLEPPIAEDDEDQSTEVEDVAVEGRNVSLQLPEDATQAEAAAVAAAIGAHISDRQRAAMAAAATADTVDHVDQWVLATRMRSHGKRRWPNRVERGNEWRAAARSF